MIARDLLSKLLAAGLSAGLFLIWWPEHHPTAGLSSLVLRGALWTLTFELLLLAFAPLERQVVRALRRRITVRRRLEVRVGGACALACAGAALPIALLAGAHAPRPAHAAHPQPQPRRVVVVKRQKVVVKREVVTVPVAAAQHPAPVSPVVVHRTVVVRRPTASRPAASTKKAPVTEPAAAPEPSPAPAPVATTPAAAAEVSAP